MQRRRGLVIAALGLLTGCAEREAKKAAADNLVDPASAQFRKIATYNEAICGEINGKNRMGAYAGFTPFVFNRATKVVVMRPESRSSSAAARSELDRCRANEYSGSCQFEQDRLAESHSTEAFDRLYQYSCT